MSVEQLAQIWPEWQIEQQLGRGSYGVVYQAVRKDSNVESYAAIKIISIPSDSSEIDSLRSEGVDLNGTKRYFKGIVDDFVREIQLMESLKGIQNIVSVEDYKVVEKTDRIGWDIYIRMELLTPFNNFVCDRQLNQDEVIKLGIDICTALEICGQRNIIHRDIKPENIFVNDFGYYKLGDFGIARKLENMTGGLSQKGTFNYMAPEVANSNNYDARVDIYSLGIILYRLLNYNRLPFLDTEEQLLNPNERKNAVERRLHGEELPPPAEASAEMANLILRACAYDPDLRFANASEMKNALIAVSCGSYVPVYPDIDKTTAVRRAKDDINATTAVRKVPSADLNKGSIPTFGKKKSSAPRVIAILVIIAILIGGTVIAYPFIRDRLADDTDEPDNDPTTNSHKTTAIVTSAENPAVTTIVPQTSLIQDPISSNTPLTTTISSPTTTVIANTTIAQGPITSESPITTNNIITAPVTSNAPVTSFDPTSTETVQSILDDAALLANSGDYIAAIDRINSGLLSFPDSVELISKRAEYEAELDKQNTKKADEYLYNLQHTNYNHNGYTSNTLFLINGKVTSFLGDTYTEGLLLKRGKKYRSSITYNLEGKYSLLTGNVSMIASGKVLGLGSFTSESYDLVRLEFYAEDELIYTTPRTNPTMDISFSVDLTGVKKLEIRIIPDDEGRYNDTNGCFALTGLELYKAGNTPNMTSRKVDNLLNLQHTNYNHNGYTNNRLFLINGKVTSFLGDTYTEGLLLKRGKKYRSSITYNLEGKYSLLTGNVSMIASGKVLGLGSFTSESYDLVRLEFYAEDELIYTTPRTNPTMDISFSVDLTGVKKLEIRIIPDDEGRYNDTNGCFALTGLKLS